MSLKLVNFYNLLKKTLVFIILVQPIGCVREAEMNPCCEDNDILDLLTGTWFLEQVTFELEDETENWKGFTITITGDLTYTTQGSFDFVIWPESGSFDLTNSNAGFDFLNRSDGAIINIIKLTDNELILILDLGDNGRWNFLLKK